MNGILKKFKKLQKTTIMIGSLECKYNNFFNLFFYYLPSLVNVVLVLYAHERTKFIETYF